MDEENQNESMIKKTGNAIKEGAKKQAQKQTKKVIKKIIMVVLPYILKAIAIVVVATIFITVLSSILDLLKGESSKNANAFAVKFTGGYSSSNNTGSEESSNSIIVNINNRTENGAYKLTYEFKDEDGNVYTEEQALTNIKASLLEENEELDLTQFSNSELKVIGALMYNGLKVEKYNEKELKALVVFVKADIAAQSFDLRSGDRTEVDINTLRDSDEVYGTLELHKTSIETDANGNITNSKEIKLKYIPYGDETTAGTFCYMVAQKNEDILNGFSIDEEGNLIIARWGRDTVTYKYLDENQNELSESDKQKIKKENILEDATNLRISLYPLKVDYKQYISKYITNYGFLSDLLVTTNNPEFCEEIAQMAFNNKIVFTVKEELTTTNKETTTKCIQTSLIYDYVKYEISGDEESEEGSWTQVTNGKGNIDSYERVLAEYGWEKNLPYKTTGDNGNMRIYEWTKDGKKYRLNYTDTASYKQWTVYVWTETTPVASFPKEENSNKESGDLINLQNNHIKEEDEGYKIDEDYTRKEELKYTVVEKNFSESNKYDIDLSEIDCWFLSYKKEYTNSTSNPNSGNKTTEVESKGQFPDEFDILIDNTNDIKQISNDTDVQDFIKNRKEQYQTSYPTANKIECKVNFLTVKQKVKTYSLVTESTKIKTYRFEDEEADTTKVRYKNIEFINGQPSYTKVDGNGNTETSFLSIYNTYRENGIDLYLENDSEKKFFELLESDNKTIGIADIMRYLLYIGDGFDRGVTELSIKILDIKLMNSVKGTSASNFIKMWENSSLWEYETGRTSIFPIGYLSEDEMNYIVYEIDGNSTKHNNIAYGISTFISSKDKVQTNHSVYGNGYYSDWKNYLKEKEILVEDLYEGAYVNKEAVDAVFETYVKKIQADVNLYLENKLPEYHFSNAQKNALVAVMYQRGNLGNFASAYVDSLNEDGSINTEKIKDKFIVNNVYVFKYTDTIKDRKYANWLLFTEETYVDELGNVIDLGTCSIVEAAYEVAEHFMNSGVDVHYAGNNVESATNNGRYCVFGNIEGAWNLPLENPDRYGVVCATYVALAIWKAGLIDTDTLNQGEYRYNSCNGINNLLTESEYADEWEIINTYEELQEGDIVWMSGHVYIYLGDDKAIDQNYCVLPSHYATSKVDRRGNLIDINYSASYRNSFIKGYRYVG